MNMLQLSIYTSIDLKLLALALQNILDTPSDVLVKCLQFSLIKIEFVSIFQSQATLGILFSVCWIYFSIKNALFSFNWELIFACVLDCNKLDLNQETHFTIQVMCFIHLMLWNWCIRREHLSVAPSSVNANIKSSCFIYTTRQIGR